MQVGTVMDGRLKTTVRQLKEGTFKVLLSQIPIEGWVTVPNQLHPEDPHGRSVVCVEDCGVCGGLMTSSGGRTGSCLSCYQEASRG